MQQNYPLKGKENIEALIVLNYLSAVCFSKAQTKLE